MFRYVVSTLGATGAVQYVPGGSYPRVIRTGDAVSQKSLRRFPGGPLGFCLSGTGCTALNQGDFKSYHNVVNSQTLIAVKEANSSFR